MSADNVICILKTKDGQCRVAYDQGADDIIFSAKYGERYKNSPYYITSTRLVELYGNVRYTRNLETAMNIAESMNRKLYVEYGIVDIYINQTWKQIVREAESLKSGMLQYSSDKIDKIILQ